jgi:hypothetical protein
VNTRPQDPLGPIPDGIEPIEAYRTWGYVIRLEQGIAELRSLNSGDPWHAGWNVAMCWPPPAGRPQDSAHAAPLEGCTCGFYATKKPVAIDPTVGFRSTPGTGLIMGKVALSGKVIEHERGYRAEKARVVELYALPGRETVAELLANRYDATVSVQEIESLPPLAPPRPAPVPIARVPLAVPRQRRSCTPRKATVRERLVLAFRALRFLYAFLFAITLLLFADEGAEGLVLVLPFILWAAVVTWWEMWRSPEMRDRRASSASSLLNESDRPVFMLSPGDPSRR